MAEFDIPDDLKNTFSNLSYLSNVGEDQKLYISENKYVSTKRYSLDRAFRYFSETYDSEIRIISDYITRSLCCFELHKNSIHFPRLVELFKTAKEGLTRLRNTYLKEGRNVNSLDNEIYRMDIRIKKLEEIEKNDFIFSKDVDSVV